jgi:COP9 signalosome complex subunit 1
MSASMEGVETFKPGPTNGDPDSLGFDWELYIQAYSGRDKVERLLFLAKRDPSLRTICSDAALKEITESMKDVKLYHRALSIRNTSAESGAPALPNGERARADEAWCEHWEQHNRVELEKLDLELRNYQNNLIKESIRMGYRDLGDHLRATGNLDEALKYYLKTRDYCSTNEHLVDMCVHVVEVALELGEYHSIHGYVSKAESLLESYDPHAAAAAASGKSNTAASALGSAAKGGTTSGADAIGALFRAGGSAGMSNATPSAFQSASSIVNSRNDAESQGKKHVRRIRTRLLVAQALAFLGQSMFEQATRALLKIEVDVNDDFSAYASRSDVAACLALCGTAMFDRSTLKASIVDQASVKEILTNDRHAQQLVDAFYSCDYKRALIVLDKARLTYTLNPTFAPHYDSLVRRITQRAVKQFVQPFDALHIARLTNALGWEDSQSEERAVDELLLLIQQGEIDGRLDLQNKVSGLRLAITLPSC